MKCFILAGGKGSRLWPLSTPKQFHNFGSQISLLHATCQRVNRVLKEEEILILTCENKEEELPRTFPVLREPCQRNTLPAIAFGISFLLEQGINKEEVCFICPSDHSISPVETFVEEILQIEQAAKESYSFISLGCPPTRLETAFGYLQKKDKLTGNFFSSRRFIEKPNVSEAKNYYQNAEYLWNTGITFFRIDVFLEALKKYVPEIYEMHIKGFNYFKEHFSELPHLSIDYGLLEHIENLLIFEVSYQWADLGSWDEIYRYLEKDAEGNAAQGNCLFVDSKNCLAFGGEKPITILGLEDVYAIETNLGLLILKKGSSQHVKDLIQRLVKKEDFS